MEKRVAIVGIIVEDLNQSKAINTLLHEHADYILGRMGLPYPAQGLSIMTIIIEAPSDVISTLSGKLGMLKGVNVKVQYHQTTGIEE